MIKGSGSSPDPNFYYRTRKKPYITCGIGLFVGTPEGTRTPNIQNRNLTLYPLNYGRISIEYFSIIAGFLPIVKREFLMKQVRVRRENLAWKIGKGD